MPEAKRTRRVRTQSEELSLEEHIRLKREELVSKRNQSEALRTAAAARLRDAERLTRRWQSRLKKDAVLEAQELLKEADVLDSMSREHDFERDVVTYLRMYHYKRQGQQELSKKESIESNLRTTDQTAHRRSAVLDEYLVHMNKSLPKVAMATRDECPRCPDAPKLLLCTSRSVMSCPECGYCVTYLDATSSSTSFDDVVEFSQYSYKRVNHYMMHIVLVQGKEAHRVPTEVLKAVAQDLYDRQGVRELQDITQRRVCQSLRRLKLKRAYDHVTQITFRLNGQRPPRISQEVEDRLKNMFLQMQPAFQRHAPKSRTNFLSYSFVLYKCFQILGMHSMLDGITLLKGRDKLEANNRIFNRMSEDLGWPLFPLPPED